MILYLRIKLYLKNKWQIGKKFDRLDLSNFLPFFDKPGMSKKMMKKIRIQDYAVLHNGEFPSACCLFLSKMVLSSSRK